MDLQESQPWNVFNCFYDVEVNLSMNNIPKWLDKF